MSLKDQPTLLHEWLQYMCWDKKLLQLESHWHFCFWAGAWTISAALGRKVWLEIQTGNREIRLYPNLYIFFVGPSTSIRKSTAADEAIPFIRDLRDQPRIIDGRVTIQNLYDQIQREQKGKAKLKEVAGEGLTPGGRQRDREIDSCEPDGFFVIYADEAPERWSKKHAQEYMFPWLTDVYRCPSHKSEGTRQHGEKEMWLTGVTLLATSAVEPLLDLLPQKSFRSGFGKRFIWIYKRKKGSWNPRRTGKATSTQKVAYNHLLKELDYIAAIEGDLEVEPRGEAQAEWEKWYGVLKEKVESGKVVYEHFGRIEDQIWKMAIIWAVARWVIKREADKPKIEGIDMRRAIGTMEYFQPIIARSLYLLDAHEIGRNAELIINRLEDAPGKTLARSELTKRTGLSKQEFNEAMLNINEKEGSGQVRAKKPGRTIIYEYIGEEIDKDEEPAFLDY